VSTTPPSDPGDDPDPRGSPPRGGSYPPPPGAYPPPPGAYQPGGYPAPGGGGWQGQSAVPFGYLAGWWSRVGGAVIDSLLITFGVRIVLGILGASSLTLAIGEQIALLVYPLLMIGSPRGRTVGMMAVGNRAVDAVTGGVLGYSRAARRILISFAIGVTALIATEATTKPGPRLLLVFLLGCVGLADDLWPLWDRRRQTLHDKVAGSVVLRIR